MKLKKGRTVGTNLRAIMANHCVYALNAHIRRSPTVTDRSQIAAAEQEGERRQEKRKHMRMHTWDNGYKELKISTSIPFNDKHNDSVQ